MRETGEKIIHAAAKQRLTVFELFEVEAVPHFPHPTRLALHLARSRAEAEDLVQETLAQALKSFDRYEAGTNCRAWLCRIMIATGENLREIGERLNISEKPSPHIACG